MFACRVDIYAHVVYHAFYRLLQTLAEARLIHIVLVLSYANGLWVNLHQLR